MKVDLNVDVHPLARIEGHGAVKVRVEDGVVKEARWDVVETPRFFEVMFKGRHYSSVGVLAARICGICSVSHCLCAICAAEKAFGVTIPETAARLRMLTKHAETIQSHILHVLFLAAPDFLAQPGVISLVQKKPELAALASRIKDFANRVCETVAGRVIHPTAFQVGGVTAVPAKDALAKFKVELEQVIEDLRSAAEWFGGLEMPEFERETEYVSLKGEQEYPFIGDRFVSSDGIDAAGDDYAKIIDEYVDRNNTSKWTRLSRESYAVGAMARFNNNFRLLRPEALKVAEALGLAPVCRNPFQNNAIQIVECFHAAYEMERILEELCESSMKDRLAEVEPKAGEGVGVLEAPRGILFHHYAYDDEGRVVKANCVVPTTQNNANIHMDMRSFAEKFAVEDMTNERLELLCSMLVRSYDPCLSCSVH